MRHPHRITFQVSTETTTADGQVKSTHADGQKRRAIVEHVDGGQSDDGRQQRRSGMFRIVLPFDSYLGTLSKETTRVRWEDSGDILNIDEIITDRTGRRWETILLCKLNK